MGMETVLSVAAIVGFVNGIRLWETNKKSFLYFLIAVVAGVLAGYLHWFQLTGLEDGFLAGLASSGFYRGAEKISGK